MRALQQKLLVAIAGLSMALPAAGQSGSAADYAKKRDAKLGEEWVSLSNWETDLDVARERAKNENKLIFGYFTRSYSP